MKTILLSFLFFIGLSASAQTDTVWTSPLTLTVPGTYANLFIKSTNSSVPCITINPQGSGVYKITNCVLYSAGDAISISGNSRDTITNNKIFGLPSTDPKGHGKAIYVYNPYSLDVEHNNLNGTGGINVQGWKGGTNDSLIIRYNQSRNIDGRSSAGVEGKAMHFIWFNTCWNVAKSDISWNENIDIPDSSVEQDVINMYNSSGVAGSPINIHDNFLKGVYPFPSTLPKTSGDGMICDGDNAAGKTKATTTSFINAYNNQFVGNGNAGMNIANGHDIRYDNNRIVASGLLPNGNKSSIFWAGVCIWNSSKINDSLMYNLSIDSNIIGYQSWGQNYPYKDRQDENQTTTDSRLNAMYRGKNFYFASPTIQLSDESAESSIWTAKQHLAGITIGVTYKGQTASPQPPVVVPVTPLPCAPVYITKDSLIYKDTGSIKVIYVDTGSIKIVHDTMPPIYYIPIFQFKPSTTPPTSKVIKYKNITLFKHEENLRV